MSTQTASLPAMGPSPPRTLRRRWWLLALLLLVALGGALLSQRRSSRAPAVQYDTAPVTRGALQAKVTATGTLSALVTVEVGSQVSGRIAELLVDFNSPVQRGQVLARIDPRLFEAAVLQARANDSAARANLEKAQAQLADAERQLTRARTLRRRNFVSQADEDTARTQVDVARAQVSASRAAIEQTGAALQQSELNLAYTTIVSPIDGIVLSRNVNVGQTVAASLQTPTLFVIAEDLRRMQVDSSVAEADIGKLRPAMKARFTVDAFPADTFEGTIRQIRNAAQTVQNVVTYDAVVDVDNPQLRLKPGMTANITIVHAERQDVLRVPNAALRFRPPAEWNDKSATAQKEAGDRRTVWALRGGKPERIPIRIGVSDGTNTELVEGALKQGDALITEVIGAGRTGPGSFGRVL